MQNENKEIVDLYIPRKCSWTNRLLSSDDYGSVQINVGLVDPKVRRRPARRRAPFEGNAGLTRPTYYASRSC